MIAGSASPQGIEPGTAMPELGVTEQDGKDIAAYLYTLRPNDQPPRPPQALLGGRRLAGARPGGSPPGKSGRWRPGIDSARRAPLRSGATLRRRGGPPARRPSSAREPGNSGPPVRGLSSGWPRGQAPARTSRVLVLTVTGGAASESLRSHPPARFRIASKSGRAGPWPTGYPASRSVRCRALNQRFRTPLRRAMDDGPGAGWMAVKIAAEVALRPGSGRVR